MESFIKKTAHLLAFSLLTLSAISSGFASSDRRWYSEQQVSQGQTLFQQHCAKCHGQNAESTPNWKQPDANGFYPPPPLNGTGHAWHHDLPLLQRTVREGGQKLGGQMPPFAQTLSAPQIDSVIAFFQSQWPDETYLKWAGRFEPAKSLALPSLDDIKKSMNRKPDTSLLQKRLGNIDIGTIKPSPIKRLYEIKLNDKFLYLSEDGQYAIVGEMIDLKSGVNLSKSREK